MDGRRVEQVRADLIDVKADAAEDERVRGEEAMNADAASRESSSREPSSVLKLSPSD